VPWAPQQKAAMFQVVAMISSLMGSSICKKFRHHFLVLKVEIIYFQPIIETVVSP
jgi:hypothetical protein